MKEKIYCHSLLSSGLLNRSFYRKCFEKGYTFQYIYENLKNLTYISPKIHWKDILNNLSLKELHNILLLGEEIPYNLRNIPDPPLYLYIKGDMNLLSKQYIALVGSRNMSVYSENITKEIVDILIQKRYGIISGMAQGVDRLAHTIALQNQNPGIGVLGRGIYRDEYVKKNELRISEYPENVLIQKYMFAERNRLISGLSQSVIIIQAAEKSGSLITAECALEQGKNIYVVPGNIQDKKYTGSNRLIRDGAYMISDLQSFMKDI